jgi:hypothetical protein
MAAKKSAKKVTAKKKSAVKKVSGTAKKSSVGKRSLVLVESEHPKEKLQKMLPGHDLNEVELWVRKPDSTKKERLVTLARLCGQQNTCITAIEHD